MLTDTLIYLIGFSLLFLLSLAVKRRFQFIVKNSKYDILKK
ncbi:hypothetical protein PSPO_a0044 [Pseudoalteromonas spongiae UST010723-006]|nr:hypothetical protein PSPO_a0044 [Pseudoalteromonas spongiae UST010723-006]